jgi:hypothetical protein
MGLSQKTLAGLALLGILILLPLQLASAFDLNVNLFDAKTDTKKVNVSVLSESTGKAKSKIINVGKIVYKTGDATIEDILFRFSDKELPPNGAFNACVSLLGSNLKQCESADRHHSVQSAAVWIRIPSR